MAERRANDVDDHVGRRIRQRRREIGMSLEKLGEALGISYQQVQKYEACSNRVSAGRLYDFTQHLGVTLDYFFEGVESPPGNQTPPEMVGRNARQMFALVKNFTQISGAGARSAVVTLVGAMAIAEAAQARPQMKPRAKRRGRLQLRNRTTERARRHARRRRPLSV